MCYHRKVSQVACKFPNMLLQHGVDGLHNIGYLKKLNNVFITKTQTEYITHCKSLPLISLTILRIATNQTVFRLYRLKLKRHIVLNYYISLT